MALKSVAILGCGPAGLMVTHAAMLSGWDFKIYSRKQKSPLYGAQYLHEYIPYTPCFEPQSIKYRLNGTPEQYRLKVYGDVWDGTTSPEDYMVTHDAWDLRMVYDFLWQKYGSEITNVDIRSDIKWFLNNAWAPADLVISTVPRKVWDDNSANFKSTKVFALGDTEMPRVDKPYRPEPFTVMCDARPEIPWYRISNIYGYCTIEWPWNNYDFGFKPAPHAGASVVEKPLSHTSTAASDFIHLGRYGKWEKGILTHDAFFDAMKVFADDKM